MLATDNGRRLQLFRGREHSRGGGAVTLAQEFVAVRNKKLHFDRASHPLCLYFVGLSHTMMAMPTKLKSLVSRSILSCSPAIFPSISQASIFLPLRFSADSR